MNDDNHPWNPLQGAMGSLRLWSDLMTDMSRAMFAFAPDSAPPDATRQVRSAMLDAWAQWWQSWLRSPQFLELMKTSTDHTVRMRKQVNEALGQMQHDLQGASSQDIDELARGLRRLEQRVSDGLARISDRLDCLEDSLRGGERPRPEKPARHRHRTGQ